jgi:DNA-binding PadR family transcriptional regulator
MANVKVNNMVKFYTLCLLATGPKHGYDLMKDLEARLNRSISASNIYPFLNILIKNKLIKIKKTGKREKKIYILTEDGKKFTKNMFSRFGDLIDIAIEPKIKACPCGCKVYSGGHPRKIKGKTINFCCLHCAGSYRKHH